MSDYEVDGDDPMIGESGARGPEGGEAVEQQHDGVLRRAEGGILTRGVQVPASTEAGPAPSPSALHQALREYDEARGLHLTACSYDYEYAELATEAQIVADMTTSERDFLQAADRLRTLLDTEKSE